MTNTWLFVTPVTVIVGVVRSILNPLTGPTCTHTLTPEQAPGGGAEPVEALALDVLAATEVERMTEVGVDSPDGPPALTVQVTDWFDVNQVEGAAGQLTFGAAVSTLAVTDWVDWLPATEVAVKA
jgi:hypothetical protein